MKSITLIALVLLASIATAESPENYSIRVKFAIQQLQVNPTPSRPPEIGGEAVGYAGAPHPTFLLYQYIYYASQDSDIERMMADPHPLVRSVGALCAINGNGRIIDLSNLDNLLDDPAPIIVGEGGCSFYFSTVGELVTKLKTNPLLFEKLGKD